MEFPHLGKHCSEQTCNRLDFLPVKCDACDKIFCSSHFNYERHACASSHRKNVQVPICPLCGEPVPTAPGVEPDITVGQHIDKQCKSDTKKIFTNRCNFKGCKRKELVPITCSQCRQNYCLRHRHVADHNCNTVAPKMSEDDRRALAAHAAEYRRSHKPTSLFNTNTKSSVVTAAARPAAQRPVTQRNNNAITTNTSQMQSIQGNMTEDEALARALALSIMELDETADRNRRTETNSAGATVSVGGRDGQTSAKDKCSLS